MGLVRREFVGLFGGAVASQSLVNPVPGQPALPEDASQLIQAIGQELQA